MRLVSLTLALFFTLVLPAAAQQRHALIRPDNTIDRIETNIDPNARTKAGWKWLLVVVADVTPTPTQVREGPVRAVEAARVLESYSVRAKTAQELEDERVSSKRVLEFTNNVSPAAVGTGATYQTVAFNGVRAGDRVITANFAADFAPLTIAFISARVPADNQLRLYFVKPTTGSVTPTVNQSLVVVVWR